MKKVELDRLSNALQRVDWDPKRLDSDRLKNLYLQYETEMQEDKRNLEYEKWQEEIYYDIIEDVKNTINWNVEHKCKCKDCECSTMRVVLTPKLFHNAKYVCNLCHRHNKWLSKEEIQEALFDL
jgi:RecG-like helicase